MVLQITPIFLFTIIQIKIYNATLLNPSTEKHTIMKDLMVSTDS